MCWKARTNTSPGAQTLKYKLNTKCKVSQHCTWEFCQSRRPFWGGLTCRFSRGQRGVWRPASNIGRPVGLTMGSLLLLVSTVCLYSVCFAAWLARPIKQFHVCSIPPAARQEIRVTRQSSLGLREIIG